MREIAVTFLGLVCSINFLLAQGKELVAEGASPVLYIIHTIQPKENYYSIGRIYNVPPKELAPFNNLDFEKGLSLGQTIKIPLTQNNFIQNGGAKSDETLIPVYHIVAAKEGLYRVSINYNKVPLEKLKKWNHLSSDAVGSRAKLIVGYLRVSKQESPLAKNAVNVTDEVSTIKDDNVRAKKPDAPKEVLPVIRNTDTTKAADPVVKDEPVKKDEITDANRTSAIRTSINFNGGSFKNLYEDQQRRKTRVTESGISGVFKSTSGWQEGKYYCFHNQAEPGTILKVTNTANNKSVYAKVLDLIPDINQNSGLILHISNSAAEELGVSGSRFNCSINYTK
ncbi:MAG: LysM peptidoglycan-binding domain-containing protein [Ginsengibacter sp.]